MAQAASKARIAFINIQRFYQGGTLLVTQGDDRVHARAAARGDERGQQGHRGETSGAEGEGGPVFRLDVEQEAFEVAGQGERSGETDDEAEGNERAGLSQDHAED